MAKKKTAVQTVFGMDVVLEEHARRIVALVDEAEQHRARIVALEARVAHLDKMLLGLAEEMTALDAIRERQKGGDDVNA